MKFKLPINLGIIFFFGFSFSGFTQNIQVGIPVLEEVIRRHQLLGEIDSSYSFLARPIDSRQLKFRFSDLDREEIYVDLLGKSNDSSTSSKRGFEFRLMPLVSSSQISTGYPYPTASNFIPSLGFQTYLTTGFFASLGPLSIQIQPEFLTAQNKDYNPGILKSDNTEFLERFGQKSYTSIYPGQSSVRLNFGAFSFGASTENIWWGPGQFNSLLFSNNAFGFQHLTFNTRRPAKTFLGSFEGQLIMGYLDSSDFANLNPTIENTERRYLNGLTISYQPKWIPGLFLGLSRVFQQFQSAREDSFSGYFPIVEGLQKKQFFSGESDSGEFDREGRDQQISVSSRYLFQNARAEVYFEYGRRDHAFDWREAVLNPEHARAYLLGFSKLFPYKAGQFIQVRGEILHQQESINIIVRYPGIAGSLNWAGHGVVRQGFTQYGQMIGPGVGPSSNVQTIEAAWVNGFNKLGIRFERLNRHQDTFIKFFAPNTENRPWVDFSSTLLGNWHWNSFILQSQVNLINSKNILWIPESGGSLDFPNGKSSFSTQSQVTLIYLFQRKNNSR
jgi:hypothetical protein